MSRSRTLKAKIQRKSVQSDFVDGAADWETIGECYIDVRPLRGREYFEASAIESTVTHKIATEYRKDLTSEMRLKVGQVEPFRYFNIESVINVNEANRWIELMCGENV